MISDVMFSSDSQEWETPRELFDQLNTEFQFKLDAASTDQNALCTNHYTVESDALEKDWGPGPVFCNPPYGRKLGDWVRKGRGEAIKGHTVVMLLPARTDVRWFHAEVLGKAEIRFIAKRLHFSKSKDAAPFPSMVVIWRGLKG